MSLLLLPTLETHIKRALKVLNVSPVSDEDTSCIIEMQN